MAISKMFFLAGMAFLFSALGAIVNLADPGSAQLPLQQRLVIDANLVVRQERMQSACFASGCHQGLTPNDAASIHKPFADGGCENCHAPAAHLQQVTTTTHKKLALCHECHSAASLGNSHLVGEDVVDPNTGMPITCDACHAPHYASKKSLLELDGRGELCLSCHKEFLVDD